MKRLLRIIFPAIAAGILLSACSEGITTDRMTIAPADTMIYNLGRTHTIYLIDSCATEKQICRQLLEMHTFQGSIEEEIGLAASQAYEEGMRTMLVERGNPLADILFPEAD